MSDGPTAHGTQPWFRSLDFPSTADERADELTALNAAALSTLLEVLGRITDAFFALDQEWRFTYLNPAAEVILQRPAASLLGLSLWDCFPDIVGTDMEASCYAVMCSGVPVTYCAPFGPFEQWFDVRVFPSSIGLTTYFREVTEERSSVRRLKQSESRFRQLVEQVPAVIYSQDVGTGARLTYISPFVEPLLGYPPETFLRQRGFWTKCIHPDDRARLRDIDDHAHTARSSFTAEYRMIARDGGIRWVIDEAIPVLDEAGNLAQWRGVVRDISSIKDAQSELLHRAQHDPLTGLANRLVLNDILEEHLPSAIPGSVSVLFLDLDRFKRINDAYGHDTGDALLVEVAERLTGGLTDARAIARFGGDEFVAIFVETGESATEATAERLLADLRRPIVLGTREVVVSGSVGIAFNHGPVGADDLLREAGLALREAKISGRDRVSIFTAVLDQAAEQLAVIADLRSAVAQRELELFYQPVLHCRTGEVATAEALLRWRHPARGLLTPADFLLVAEETGLIVPIGYWVLEQACFQHQAWRTTFGNAAPHEISVNIAAQQLRDPAFPARVLQLLEEHGLTAGQLRLEITERIHLGVLQGASTVLDQLLRAGIRFSIDDFGAGNSSLAFLQTFRADDLKLDRTLVERSTSGDQHRAIMSSITSLGHALGMIVTAEGVETIAQLDAVRRAGCDRVQGHGIAPAMSAPDFAMWLASVVRSPRQNRLSLSLESPAS